MKEILNKDGLLVGTVPDHWTVCKTLFVLSMPITDGPHTTPMLYSEGIPFISAEAVSTGNGRINFNHIRGYISKDFYNECCKKYIPEIDDIYMIKSGATTGKVAIVDTDKVFTIWSPLAVFRVNRNIVLPRFFYYFIQSETYKKQVELGWNYGTQQNIGMRMLEKLYVAFPALEEQGVIITYIDNQCSKIDEAISRHRSIIEKLEEYRKAVIAHAVTNGLDVNVETKDSEVEWIEKLPSMWKIVRLKSEFIFKKGLSITKADLTDKGENVISYGQIHSKNCDGVHVNNELVRYVPSDITVKNQNSRVAPFGFIFADTSEDLSGCGNAIYVGNRDDIYGGYHTIVLNPKICRDNRYLAYLFRTDIWRSQLRSQLTEVKLFSVSQKSLKEVDIILPPDSEMQKIADYLDDKCSLIDEAISRQKAAIEKLEEYKKSIIYNAVTGKIDCRNISEDHTTAERN